MTDGEMLDGGVTIRRANDGETITFAEQGVTSVIRANESIPAPTIEVRRDKRASEMRELQHLRRENATLRSERDQLADECVALRQRERCCGS